MLADVPVKAVEQRQNKRNTRYRQSLIGLARLGGSLLDLIKHYRFKGIPTDLVRPLVVAVGVIIVSNCRCCQVWHFSIPVESFTQI